MIDNQLSTIFSKDKVIAKSAEIEEHGVSRSMIAKLCEQGILFKIAYGYYKLANQEFLQDEQIIASIYPDGILCMDSALFFYEYSNRTPSEWTLAFERNVSRSRFDIDIVKIKPYFISSKYIGIGETQKEVNSVTLKVYDRERVICDCFKHRNKMDAEMFSKAVQAFSKDKNKNLANLSKYAKQMRIYKKVSEIMGVLL